MENTYFLISILGPICLIFSLSTLIYVKVWQKVLDSWLKNHLLLLPLMYMELIFGVLIVYFHNVWVWDLKTLIVTILGWDMVLESSLYFLFPGSFIKWALKIGKTTAVLVIGGLIGTAIGLYFCYLAHYETIVTAIQGVLQ